MFNFAYQLILNYYYINLKEVATDFSRDGLSVPIKQIIGAVFTIVLDQLKAFGAILDIMLNPLRHTHREDLLALTDLASGFVTLLGRGVEASFQNTRTTEKAESSG